METNRFSSKVQNFHATRKVHAPPLPAFLFLFKSANAALAVRTLSNIFLSFLPFALRKNPKTGRPRRILLFISTVLPLTGFGILILAGLEQAPHTNRWRFRYMSLEEENEICSQAFLIESNNYKDKILSDDRIETIFVRHVMNNLIKGLNDDLMTLKNFKNVDTPKDVAEENIISDDFGTQVLENKQEDDKPVPFEVFVIEDDTIMNALSFGVSKKIFVFTGWLNVIEYDEEFLSVTLAHEIGHVLQRHASETLGFNQVMYILADTARTLLWPFLSVLGPLINDYLNSVTQELIDSYGSGRYNQREEKEADIIGLQLMALAGYKPKRAVELWEYISMINKKIQQEITESQHTLVLPPINETTSAIDPTDPPTTTTTQQDTEKPRIILENISEFFASHPMEEVRAKYLVDLLPDAEKIYENVIANGGQARPFSLEEHKMENPIEKVRLAEEWLFSKIWSGIRSIVGL